MTTSYNSLTVVLEKETREEDAEYIMNAIRMIKGVMKVVPEVADRNHYIATETAKHELMQKVFKIFQENK